MLDFILLYISGYQAADLGSRPGRGIPSEKGLKKESAKEGAREGLGCCLESPLLPVRKAVPFQSCHGAAEGLLLLTFMAMSSHHKLVRVFWGISCLRRWKCGFLFSGKAFDSPQKSKKAPPPPVVPYAFPDAHTHLTQTEFTSAWMGVPVTGAPLLDDNPTVWLTVKI